MTLDTRIFPSGSVVRRAQLSDVVKRSLLRHENYLQKKCRSIWAFTNPEGAHYIFARLGKLREDCTIVTIAYFHKDIGKYISLN